MSPAASPTAKAQDATTIDSTKLGARDELLGSVLNGRFVIQKELKRGGMGVVYVATDQQLHSRPVVIKVLLDEAYQSEYVLQKFRQEVEALSRIDHPGIVGIIDAGELPNGRPFIAMQYVEGVTLRSLMLPEGMDLNHAGDLMKQVGRALAAAHNRGIFHRDLKPDNIMVQSLGPAEEQVKIIDFGIAKVKDSVVAPSTSLDLSVGTVAYMAPEQLSGRSITAATDVFALGVIAYEILTGRKPFNPETGYELLQMQQSGVRVKPSDLRPGITAAAQQIILRALSFNPTDRQSDPRDFGDSLARALGEAGAEPPFNQPEAGALPPTRLPNQDSPNIAPPSTRQTPFAEAAPINPSATQLGFGGRSRAGRSPGSKIGLVLGLAVVIIGALAIGGWYFLLKKGKTSEAAPPSAAERNLSYGLTVQKMRGGRPYQDPFESSGQEIFENGWKFRMNISSSQEGYLYLLNEGPAGNGVTTYNVLFPEPHTNEGSPRVAADKKLQTAWMRFDDHQGTEKFWLVWSATAVKELDAVRGAVNTVDQGRISDENQAKAVRDFLSMHSSSSTEIARDQTNKVTSVKGKGDVLVSFIALEHH